VSHPAPEALEALRQWLVFQWEAGVDIALDDVARDRFAEVAEVPARTAAAAPGHAHQAGMPSGGSPISAARATGLAPAAGIRARGADAPPSPDTAAADARARAASAQTLDALRSALDAFDGCGLKKTASRLVFEDGTRGAPVMLIGEAPGADEDREGKPFVGRSGQLLDRMLATIGLDRASVYIGNVVPWRPPGNRKPTPQEVSACEPFLLRQVELAAPRLVVCLGSLAVETVTGRRDGVMRLQGQWLDHPAIPGLRVLAMAHPAYLLRQPIYKKRVWCALLALETAIKAL
jgi:DNA polymerase